MRRILERMSRRLGALLLVSVVATAPAVLTACEIVCAVRDSHRLAGHSAPAGHSCHGTQPSHRPGLEAGVQVCGHDEALLSASQAPAFSIPPLVVAAPSMFVSLGDAPHRAHVVVSSPPGHYKVQVPLRV